MNVALHPNQQASIRWISEKGGTCSPGNVLVTSLNRFKDHKDDNKHEHRIHFPPYRMIHV